MIGNAFIDDLIANSFDDLLNSSDHPPQHQTHSIESYNDNPNYSYPPQEPFVYNQDSCYEQNFIDNSQSPLQPQYEMYSYELCGNDAHYGYDSPPQVPETPKVLSLAWDKFFEIQHAQPEDTHEFLRKLLEDLQIINEELAEYINSPSWNRPAFYDDDDEYSIQYKEYLENFSNAIAPIDEVIKSSVGKPVLILSESEGISDDTCDVPFCDNSHPLDVLTNHFELFSDFNNDCTSSDDDYFKDINYVEASPPDSELVSLEEVQDDIFREKLLNINLLIAKIESLNDNSTPDCVLKSPSLFPIPIEDSDSLFQKSDTSLSYSDNSLPEFETFSDHTEEMSSGSTTTHADNSLPEYDLKNL
nr:hypothetical protein [Tanacetum cinerariifolium]